jgi:hypothetical protein
MPNQKIKNQYQHIQRLLQTYLEEENGRASGVTGEENGERGGEACSGDGEACSGDGGEAYLGAGAGERCVSGLRSRGE